MADRPVAVYPADEQATIAEMQRQLYSLNQSRFGMVYDSHGAPVFKPGIVIGEGVDTVYINVEVPPPTGLLVTTGSTFDETYVDAFWSPPVGLSSEQVVGYNVEWTQVGFGVVGHELSPVTSKHIPRLKPETDYTVRVQAVNRIGRTSTWTAAVPIHTGKDATNPPQVTGLVASASIRGVNLSWTESPAVDVRRGAGQYWVEYATDAAFTIAYNSFFTDATLAPVQPLPAALHYFRVTAIDSSGNFGTASAVVSATPGQISSSDISSNMLAKYTAVVNHSFEELLVGDSTRAASWVYDLGGGAVYNINTASPRAGSRALTMQAPTAGYGYVHSAPIPVVEGQTWVVQVPAKGGTAGSTGGLVRVIFGTSEAANELAWVDVIPLGTVLTTAWVDYTVQAVAPAGAKWMRVALFNWTPSTNMYTIHYDEVVAIRAVIADFIKAGQINSDHISTTGLDAGHIKFGAMDGDRIAANTASIGILETSELTSSIITVTGTGMIRVMTTAPPYNYLFINNTGMKFFKNGTAPGAGGTQTVAFEVATGNASFSGVIDASDIVASSFTGGVITSAHFQTEITGSRVVIGQPANPDEIRMYTGETGEINPGILQVFQSSSDWTSPEFVAGRFANIRLVGQGGPEALARPKIYIGGAPAEFTSPDIALGAYTYGLSAASSISVGADSFITLQSDTSINLSATTFLNLISADVVDITADTSRILMSDPALDMIHDSGGRVRIDDTVDFILGATTQMQIDGGEAGVIGSSGFAFNVVGLGWRRIRVGVPDSGGAGRRLVYMEN